MDTWQAACEDLRARGVPELALDVLERSIQVVDRVCERATAHFDPAGEGDDDNLLGLMCAKRSRNLLARVLAEELAGVVVRRPRGTLELEVDGWLFYLYAGKDDDVVPRLRGSVTKDELLSRFEQLSLWTTPQQEGLPLLIAYRRTVAAGGLSRMVVGLPNGPESWSWSTTLFARPTGETAPTPMAAYDAQEVPSPSLRLRPRAARASDER